jgi:hypothetical protein
MRIHVAIPRCLPVHEVALVTGTLEALVHADLADLAETLGRSALQPRGQLSRVLELPADPDAQAAQLTAGVRTTLTLTCELLLRELFWLANVPGWSVRMRREAGYGVLALAGFGDQGEGWPEHRLDSPARAERRP